MRVCACVACIESTVQELCSTPYLINKHKQASVTAYSLTGRQLKEKDIMGEDRYACVSNLYYVRIMTHTIFPV